MRPLLIRLAPLRFKPALFSRFYSKNRHKSPQLFESASLHFAPSVKMQLSLSDVFHGLIAFTGLYEPSMSEDVVRKGKAGGLFVDVGANYGYFSLLWAAQRPGNRVIALEASPRNISSLKANITANGFENVVKVHANAVGREPGQMFFDMGPQEQTGWGGLVLKESNTQGTIVDVITLDHLLKDEPKIDVLKIDIEGADFWALEGAKKLLAEHRIEHVYFEENKGRMAALGINPGEGKKLLKSYGYEVESTVAEETPFVEYHAFLRGE